MDDTLARAFMSELHALERDRDIDGMVSLFAEDADLWRSPREKSYRGKAGARAFWSEYLHMFNEVETEFRVVTVASRRALLEWRSRGTLRSGSSFAYTGASVIEGDDEISSFRTYYDPIPLLGPSAGGRRAPGGVQRQM